MPFRYHIDASNSLVVVTGSGLATMEQRRQVIGEMMESSNIAAGTRFLFLVGDVQNNVAPAEMAEVQQLILRLHCVFGGRIAIVNTHPGHVTTTVMVTIMAGNQSIRSFMDEQEARQWLLSPSQ